MEIPITLSTSSAQLDATSLEPFYIVVTAHNAGDKPVTFSSGLTPFMGLLWGTFENIECISTPAEKLIEIYPRDWPRCYWNEEDVKRDDFITINCPGNTSIGPTSNRESGIESGWSSLVR